MTDMPAVRAPQCFFCDRILTWNTAYIAPFGKVLCRKCNGDDE